MLNLNPSFSVESGRTKIDKSWPKCSTTSYIAFYLRKKEDGDDEESRVVGQTKPRDEYTEKVKWWRMEAKWRRKAELESNKLCVCVPALPMSVHVFHMH